MHQLAHMLLTCSAYSSFIFANTPPLLLLALSSLPPPGYSLNALVDFPADDPIEVIKHLIIGSEGTLGFVSQVGCDTQQQQQQQQHSKHTVGQTGRLSSSCHAVGAHLMLHGCVSRVRLSTAMHA
jgi:hypothetical protein